MVYAPYPSVTSVSGFMLDSKFHGWLESVSHSQPPSTPHLRVSPEVTMTCGTGMSREFYAWVADSFTRFIYHDACIITKGSGSDSWSNRTQRLALKNAQVTEIGFPALDAASKDPATLSVKFRAETAQTLSGGFPFNLPPKSKPLSAHFRFLIEGMGEACQMVRKIDPILVKGVTQSGTVGGRGSNGGKGVMQSEVAITLSMTPAEEILRALGRPGGQPSGLARGSIQIDLAPGLAFGLRLTGLALFGPPLLLGGGAQPFMKLRMRGMAQPFLGPPPVGPTRGPVLLRA